MSKKFLIKRKIRFHENLKLNSYTGLIFVNSFLPKTINESKPIRINITNFYFYKNNFCLLDKFIPKNEIKKYITKGFNIKNNILSIDTIFLRNKKTIYLIYLKQNTKVNNFTILRTMNMFKKSEFNYLENQDLYQAIFNFHDKISKTNYKILYDKDNYIELNLKTIFYYMIGNEHIIKL